MKLIIIGGVAGGPTAAVKARRLSENVEIIMVERGAHVSLATCGLPYYIGGEIDNRQALELQSKETLARRFNLDIRTETEAVAINCDKKIVTLKDLNTGCSCNEDYDFLLLSPGAKPIVPKLPGTEQLTIHTVRNLQDIDRLQQTLSTNSQRALIIGAGYIGLELTENLIQRGHAVTLIEAADQVLAGLDREMAQLLHQKLFAKSVDLHLKTSVNGFEQLNGYIAAYLSNGSTAQTDLVIAAVGVKPDSTIAIQAGLAVTPQGAIVVDQMLRTSDPSIYAVGDAIASPDLILGDQLTAPLAGPANRQACVAVNNIFGKQENYRGICGTSIIRLFDLTAASTGWNEKRLRQRNLDFRKIYVQRTQHVSYFPDAKPMLIKLLFAPVSGKLFGCQIVGSDGVDKRIDVIATAIQGCLTAKELCQLELAYAPQYGAAKDPVNIAGYVAKNLLENEESFVYAEDLSAAALADFFVLDVRSTSEYQHAHLPGAVNIPFEHLRQRLSEIPETKPLLCYCSVGQRSYYANRILRAHGYKTSNLAGGYAVYCLFTQPADSITQLPAKESFNNCSVSSCPLPIYSDDTENSTTTRYTLDLRGKGSAAEAFVTLNELTSQLNLTTTVKLIADQVGFENDLQNWCNEKGYQILGTQYNNSQLEAFITLSSPAVSAE